LMQERNQGFSTGMTVSTTTNKVTDAGNRITTLYE